MDPECEGGKLNSVTTEDIVEENLLQGKEYLFYKAQPLDIAVMRGTEADENGNIRLWKEALTLLEHLAYVMAVLD